MFRPTMIRLALLGAAVTAAIAAAVSLNRWRHRWGIDPADVDRLLPGDDLVPAPSNVETRGIEINAPPAAVFMGDTGSLALGGALGPIAVTTHHELVLGIIGGLFVIEALSVIIQVFFFKRTGKRVFKMAPIHHHFEQLGWSEPTVVIRFWIIAFVLALAGLSTLKLR